MSSTMNRVARLLAHRPPTGTAVEVAAYFNPALPKRDGNDVLIIDVFDTATLRERAKDDPDIPNDRISEIEEVDIVGDASAIGDLLTSRGLAGTIAYVVSSHNFEHLPNPIRFLQGVEKVLMPGGVLSMAIPDCRATFDHFRSMTRLVDWLAAFHDQRSQPSADTVFDLVANRAAFPTADGLNGAGDWRSADPREARFVGDLQSAYSDWLSARKEPKGYRDSHVSVIFDAQFALLIEDLRFLGLIGLEVVEITRNHGHEFFAHLRRPVQGLPPTSAAHYAARREALMRRVTAEFGDCAFPRLQRPLRAAMSPKSILRTVIGTKRYDSLKRWTRARRARKRGAE